MRENYHHALPTLKRGMKVGRGGGSGKGRREWEGEEGVGRAGGRAREVQE